MCRSSRCGCHACSDCEALALFRRHRCGDVGLQNQARDSPPRMAQGMRTRKAPPRCTAQPDVALAMTLPRLLKPMIRAAADSEKPTELSTAGVQNVTVTSTMKIVKNGTQRRSVGTARPSMNRCLKRRLSDKNGRLPTWVVRIL